MMLEMDLPNKKEVVANLYACIGNAYVEMEQYEKALKHHLKDLEISRKGWDFVINGLISGGYDFRSSLFEFLWSIHFLII